MKVKELKKGMLLAPAGDGEIFSLAGPWSEEKMKWLRVITKPRRGRSGYGEKEFTGSVMYLGTRKDLNVGNDEASWSNRFALVEGEIVSVDPAAWRRIKELSSESR